MQATNLNHQMMGYDRSAMFSPDGRLLQVEYAKKAVKQGTISLGIVYKEGVLLLADKRILERLMIGDTVEKVFKVDDHIGASVSGYLMDGRILIERAQILAQQHRVTYDESIGLLSLVKEVASLKQSFTQYGGARPFGVGILFIGCDDDGPQLYMTDVAGIYFQYKATAIGESENQIKEVLDSGYKDDMNFEDALGLGLGALKQVFDKDFDVNRIGGAFINMGDMKFKKISIDVLKKHSKQNITKVNTKQNITKVNTKQNITKVNTKQNTK